MTTRPFDKKSKFRSWKLSQFVVALGHNIHEFTMTLCWTRGHDIYLWPEDTRNITSQNPVKTMNIVIICQVFTGTSDLESLVASGHK